MKRTFFLAAFILQFVSFGFAQIDSAHHYSIAEIKKFSAYIIDLENRNTARTSSEYAVIAKEQIDELLNDHTHSFTDFEVIELAVYIKALENENESACIHSEEMMLGRKRNVRDSINAYTNTEAIKLANYK